MKNWPLSSQPSSGATSYDADSSIMNSPLPSFSVVIPTYNRHAQLSECLVSLAKLAYPRDRYEVIVVDDESPMTPEVIVTRFRDRMRVELIVQPHGGPARARNAGASVARGEYLAFTDDDCTPTADWLLRLSERLAEAPGHAVGGRTVNRLPRNSYSTASQMLIDYLYGYFSRRKGRFFTSNNLAMSTVLYRTLGGFDTDMPLAAAEDREFCDRWTDHGYSLLEAPEAVVEHAHTLDFRGFCRQHFNYGRGAYYYRRIVARRGKKNLRIEPFHFYSNLLLYPSRRESSLQSLALSLLLAIAQAANAAGFVYETVRPCHALDSRLARA